MSDNTHFWFYMLVLTSPTTFLPAMRLSNGPKYEFLIAFKMGPRKFWTRMAMIWYHDMY